MNIKRINTVFGLLTMLLVFSVNIASYANKPDISKKEKTEKEVTLPKEASKSWWATVQEDIKKKEYNIIWQKTNDINGLKESYQAPNRKHNFRTYFTKDGIRVIPRSEDKPTWEWSFNLIRFGFKSNMQNVKKAEIKVTENKIEYKRGFLTEWYVNDEKGLEQGFTLTEAPKEKSKDEFIFEMDLTGNVIPQIKNGVVKFVSPGGACVVNYSNLKAFDAKGKKFPARLALNDKKLSIIVDIKDAVYPVTIDPLATSASWTAEGKQANAYFGISVSTAGDVNGDGYSDVIVGAFNYDNGGKVFAYYGSADGLSVTPNWTAESDQSGANYGISVSTAGDVNGDGYSDVIVGAYCYDNSKTNTGRVYVYYGSTDGLSASASWTAESNQENAYLGFSVSTAGS